MEVAVSFIDYKILSSYITSVIPLIVFIFNIKQNNYINIH